MTGCGGWEPRIPPPASRWLVATRCLLGRSQADAGGRISCCGAVFKSNGSVRREGGCGGAVVGRGGGWGAIDKVGADSRLSMRDAVRSDWESSVSIEVLAEDFHASRAVSLSSTFVRAASNPSNFFARSSMAVVIWAWNWVCLCFGARSIRR